jgi:hypothetical protein
MSWQPARLKTQTSTRKVIIAVNVLKDYSLIYHFKIRL